MRAKDKLAALVASPSLTCSVQEGLLRYGLGRVGLVPSVLGLVPPTRAARCDERSLDVNVLRGVWTWKRIKIGTWARCYRCGSKIRRVEWGAIATAGNSIFGPFCRCCYEDVNEPRDRWDGSKHEAN